MPQNKSMAEGVKTGLGAADGFPGFLTCEGDVVLKRQLGVHQGFWGGSAHVDLGLSHLPGCRVSDEWPIWPQVLPSCVCVC